MLDRALVVYLYTCLACLQSLRKLAGVIDEGRKAIVCIFILLVRKRSYELIYCAIDDLNYSSITALLNEILYESYARVCLYGRRVKQA